MTDQKKSGSPDAPDTWAAFLRERLDRANLYGKDLATAIGADKSTVSLWLSGKRTPRDPATLRKVAAAFSVDPKSVFLAAGIVDPADDLTTLVIERPLSEVPDIELYAEVRRRLSGQQRPRRSADRDTNPLIPPIWSTVTRTAPGTSLLAQTSKVAQHAGAAVGAALENTGPIDEALADTILAAIGALQARGNTDITATILTRWTATTREERG